MDKIIEGVVHGRTIELLGDPAIGEDQRVKVALSVSPSEGAWGEGIRRTAGALADDPHWDAVMAEVHEGRRREGHPHS